MLPKIVYMPALGTFNSTLSRFEYRGAAPIQTGQLSMAKSKKPNYLFIDDKIDTGAMILTKFLLMRTMRTTTRQIDGIRQ
jgi:methionyl-tRNA formyltransferase